MTLDAGEFDRTASRAAADWALLQKLRDKWGGNLVVKGVLCPDDAVRMKEIGVDAIQVNIQSTFRQHSVNIQSTFSEHSVNIQ
jgi:isopentenyl diphosphate isomerase/L-lactate dehydrogenase-like FMN-dependent dehydrogenase